MNSIGSSINLAFGINAQWQQATGDYFNNPSRLLLIEAGYNDYFTGRFSNPTEKNIEIDGALSYLQPGQLGIHSVTKPDGSTTYQFFDQESKRSISSTTFDRDGYQSYIESFKADGSAKVTYYDKDGLISVVKDIAPNGDLIRQIGLNPDGTEAWRQEISGPGSDGAFSFGKNVISLSQVGATLGSTLGAFLGGNSLVGRIGAPAAGPVDLAYPAKVSLSRDFMWIDGRREPLRPGMRVSAEIETGERRVIEYLLSPVVQAVKEAGRER